MDLILLTHPEQFSSTSMPRFATFIADGMQGRGHSVDVVSSKPIFSRGRDIHRGLGKWLNYFDQFVMFPRRLKTIIRNRPPETLVVVADQALGMWVPTIAHRPHVIHCHDFLALRSALGEVPENPTSTTGRQYQRLIRRGFSSGKNFISVSRQTQSDLHRFLETKPACSDVIYNGLNGPFRQSTLGEARSLLHEKMTDRDENGFLLHVGGNQWYKNRLGVVAIYAEYCKRVDKPIPLWLVGASATEPLQRARAAVPTNGQVRFVTGLTNEQVIAAYNLASLFLFPSLDEGFGWPIAEAMACGTRVVTTERAPMTEVGGDAAYYIPRGSSEESSWAHGCALTVLAALEESSISVWERVDKGLKQSRIFNSDSTLEGYEAFYRQVLSSAGVAV